MKRIVFPITQKTYCFDCEGIIEEFVVTLEYYKKMFRG